MRAYNFEASSAFESANVFNITSIAPSCIRKFRFSSKRKNLIFFPIFFEKKK